MDYKDITCGGEILQLKQFNLKNLVYDQNGKYLNPLSQQMCDFHENGESKPTKDRYIKFD